MRTHLAKPVTNIVQRVETGKGASLVPPSHQKRENKTGMPDQLKSGVESLSGLDMSDVRIHYNSSQPAQLNAYAYAQGNQIHLAPGQEKHLSHEAWHVVQQKQGRVKPTRQMKEKKNNSTVADGSVPVQRKTGLEFQTLANVWTEKEDDSDEGFGPDVEFESAPVYQGMRKLLYGDKVFQVPGLFHIESDDGDIEFVTEPFDEDESGFMKLTIAVHMMAQFAELIGNNERILFETLAGEFGTGTFDSKRDGFDVFVGDMKSVDERPDVTASPQASVGVKLDKIIAMYEAVSKSKELGSFAIWGTKNPPEHRSQMVIKESLNTAKNADRSSKVDNLIFLVIHYLQGAKAYSKDLKDKKNYPKIAHPVMVRTSFKAIYQALTAIEQTQFRDFKDYLLGIVRMKGNEPIYKDGYRDDSGEFHEPANVLTVGAWIDSIVAGGNQPDKLSRLPGMIAGRGMGAMQNTDQVAKHDSPGKPQAPSAGVVLELRRMMTRLPPDAWVQVAQAIHHIVNDINEVKKVKPHPQSIGGVPQIINHLRSKNNSVEGNLNAVPVGNAKHPEY